MKKSIASLVIVTLLGTLLTGLIFKVQTEAFGSSCEVNHFQLFNIQDDKTWAPLECHPTFEAAKTAMNAKKKDMPNLVITHDASYSPLKIVAASRAVAASYPFRTGSGTSDHVTVNIYRNANFTGDSTYISRHLDMAYYDTVSYNSDTGSGSVSVQIAGFSGYIPLIQIDIVPLIYVEKGWNIQLGGKTYKEQIEKDPEKKLTYEQPFTLIPKMNQYRVYDNSAKSVREISHEAFSWWDAHSYGRYVIGIAPEWLPNGTYYSWNGINFYTDVAMTQPVKVGDNVGTYYNYYLYLPLRSKSNYTAAELDAYLESINNIDGSVMKNEGKSFVEAQNKYGMNALLVYALAMHESYYGASSIAKSKNNLFGWGAFDSNPDDAMIFESIAQSVSEHMGINLRGYLSIENWRYFGQAYANKDNGLNAKYASDPYWGQKIAGHAYRLDRFHNYKDYAKHNVGIINKDADIIIKKEANIASGTLFTMGAKLKTQSFLLTNKIVEGENTIYEIMSPMPVVNGNIVRFNETSKQLVEYDWEKSRGYLINEPIYIAYEGTEFPGKPEEPVEPEEPDAPVVLLGDVNGDGLVDVLDLAKTSRYLAELDNLVDNAKIAADINKDGIVDVLDLARLSRILAELE